MVTPKEMLDLRFSTLLTPVLVPAIHGAVVALAAVTGAGVIVLAAVHAWWLGLLALVVVPPAVTLVIALVRVGCELLWYLNELHGRRGSRVGSPGWRVWSQSSPTTCRG